MCTLLAGGEGGISHDSWPEGGKLPLGKTFSAWRLPYKLTLLDCFVDSHRHDELELIKRGTIDSTHKLTYMDRIVCASEYK